MDAEEVLSKRGWGAEFQELLAHGTPEGKDWCPTMADAPLRNHEWFWEERDEEKLYSLEALVNMYYKSVGRNSTLILGAVPNARGLVPKADIELLGQLGREVERRFAQPVAETKGEGERVELALPEPRKIDCVVIMEEIAQGERVRQYEIVGSVGGREWKRLGGGSCIGHKRIEPIGPVEVDRVALEIGESRGTPLIRQLSIYDAE